jgi:hypothetical protein
METTRRRPQRQGLPVFRIVLLVAFVGVILIGGGVASFLADQQSRRQPFEIELYPGAERWGEAPGQTATSRSVFYRIPGTSPETVMNFYQDELRQHSADGEERCIRFPAEGEVPANELQSGTPPYYFTCFIDRSGLGTTQYTQVVVMPGVANPDPAFDTQGMTVVEYEQTWQP